MNRLKIIAGVVLPVLFTVIAVTCTGNAPPKNPAPSSTASSAPDSALSSPASPASGNLPLRTLRDVPLSGGATRFDYQSFDQNTGRLYIAHLGDGALTIFDVNKETVIGDVK